MTDETDGHDLIGTIAFALGQCRYKPPRTHDRTQLDAYYKWVATSVRDQLIRSNWEITQKPRRPIGPGRGC